MKQQWGDGQTDYWLLVGKYLRGIGLFAGQISCSTYPHREADGQRSLHCLQAIRKSLVYLQTVEIFTFCELILIDF